MTVELTECTLEVAGTSLTVRNLTADDSLALLALHTRVFGLGTSRAWYNWKYGHGPGAGNGLGSGIWAGNELVAHCGGVPRLLWARGQSIEGLQIGDVMVDPAWRGVLTRRGPFFQVSRHFYSTQVGSGCQFMTGFGFPSARHLKLAKMLDLLEDGGSVLGLDWAVTPSQAAGLNPLAWRLEPLDAQTLHGQNMLTRAWAAQQAASAGLILGDRSLSYLWWRFVARPDQNVQMWAVRRPWKRHPLGVVVLSLPPHRPAHWLDWIGPPGAANWGCRAALQAVALQSMQQMQAWATPAVVACLAEAAPSKAPEVVRLGLVGGSVWPVDHLASDLQWWLMGGDTDFL